MEDLSEIKHLLLKSGAPTLAGMIETNVGKPLLRELGKELCNNSATPIDQLARVLSLNQASDVRKLKTKDKQLERELNQRLNVSPTLSRKQKIGFSAAIAATIGSLIFTKGLGWQAIIESLIGDVASLAIGWFYGRFN